MIEQIYSCNLLAKTLLIIFASIGIKEIGQYDDIYILSRPGLGINTMLALYSVRGSFDWENE